MIQQTPVIHQHPASWRDPSGFVFIADNELYRQVNKSYATHYRRLMQSGLYATLTEKEWLVPHEEINTNISGHPDWLITLKPRRLPFISYPYEWSFDMLKDAALLTLRINLLAMEKGMILKDASPFNIQFNNARAIFIDTLSFEIYDETKSWIAYRQFCESFLFPLYLCHYCRIDAQRLLSVHLGGIPIADTARLLPFSSRFNLGVWLHVHLQHKITRKNNNYLAPEEKFSRQKMFYLMQGLISSIKKLSFRQQTTWSNYYDDTILSKQYLQDKEILFRSFISGLSFQTVLDIGANEGYFSQIASPQAKQVIAIDTDSHCINRLYLQTKANKENNTLPLIIDITNPSPANGFNNTERDAFLKRSVSDMVLALALIHHLYFSGNIPFHHMALLFHRLCNRYLIIEFIPGDDKKVTIIKSRNDATATGYNAQLFEDAFSNCFTILKKEPIGSSGRILYLMEKLN